MSVVAFITDITTEEIGKSIKALVAQHKASIFITGGGSLEIQEQVLQIAFGESTKVLTGAEDESITAVHGAIGITPTFLKCLPSFTLIPSLVDVRQKFVFTNQKGQQSEIPQGRLT